MHYHNLYTEYLNQTDILKSYIKSLKSKIGSNAEPESTKYRISILYSMYLDMKHTCEYLKIRCEESKK